MTISSETTKVSYSGNASTTAFAYTFKITASTDLKVYIRSSAGVETLKAEGTGSANYGVSGVGESTGGNVTFVTAPASGETVVILRDTPKTQATDYTENAPFPADSHEAALDKVTVITQEMQEELDRTLKVSRTSSITTPEITDSASDRAGKLLGFSADGNTLESTTGRVSSVSVSAVAAGGTPTVSFTTSTGALALGVVTGNTGATGATGDVDDVLTTRGDMIIRNASTSARLAIGSANTVLTTDGTDPAWSTVTNAMLAGSITNAKLAGSIADSKLSTISTADKVAGGAIQIDSGTDGTSITIVDADKFLVDDGGTTKYVNASQVKTYIGSAKITAEFISSATDITADSVHTFSHSLGARPSVVQVYIKCTSADAGWASGDYLLLGGSAGGNGGSIDCGYMIQADATNVEVVLGACIRIHNQSTFNEVSANLSNWDWVVVAYKGGSV